jgi:hypothetical protein
LVTTKTNRQPSNNALPACSCPAILRSNCAPDATSVSCYGWVGASRREDVAMKREVQVASLVLEKDRINS